LSAIRARRWNAHPALRSGAPRTSRIEKHLKKNDAVEWRSTRVV
jgi:hypothetical protein